MGIPSVVLQGADGGFGPGTGTAGPAPGGVFDWQQAKILVAVSSPFDRLKVRLVPRVRCSYEAEKHY